MQNTRSTWLALLAVLGAFLGFTVEPLVGRLVTLSYGGAVHVWTVCVLLFQVLLFAGYAWAHLVVRRWPRAHIALVALALIALPLRVQGGVHPAGDILPLVWTVLVAVGLPFMVLSSASIVAQIWYDQSDLGPPWWLYGASNAASLGGLFAYPLLIEPYTTLTTQRWAWSVAFVAFVALTAWLAPRSGRAEDRGGVTPRQVVLWMGVAAAPSALLLALTNRITLEFGSFPLIWTVPLGLYLASFILAFRVRRSSPPVLPFWPDILLFLALFTMTMMVTQLATHPLIYLLFFLICWLCHDQLYAHRPKPESLTWFYLAIAAGGAVGSALVTLVAPMIFTGLWELPLSILACAGAIWVTAGPPSRAWFKAVHPRWSFSRMALDATAIGLLIGWSFDQASRQTLETTRSLYGVFEVREEENENGRYRRLLHGHTVHGTQYVEPPLSEIPMSYYHPEGGNAQALALRNGPRIAGVGLGAGAVAGLIEPGETLVFYELDPNAEHLARTWFTYIDDADGTVEVRLGDARLNLALEGDPPYDALFVDAFSGDGVPSHLLTREAFTVWTDRLADDGVLVFHISNRYFALDCVLAELAKDAGWHARIWQDFAEGRLDPLYAAQISVVMAADPERLSSLSEDWKPLDEGCGLWTDDYVNLLAPLARRYQ